MAKKDTDNLVPTNKRSKSEVREIGRKGGIASGEARRRKRDIYQIANVMLNSGLKGKNAKAVKDLADIADEDLTVNSLMVAGQIRSAVKGNTKAFEVLTNMQEKAAKKEETAQEYQMSILDITSDFVTAYREMHEAFNTGKWREFIFKGGRGSVKSNFISAFAEETIYNDPQAHIVFTRRYKTDLRGSVYNQFKKTIIRHNKVDEWEFTTSPMQAVYKSTGQKVIFVGCDKPISLKSYNLEFGYAVHRM